MKNSFVLVLAYLISFPVMAIDFSAFSDEIGNGVLSRGVIGGATEVIESEACVFRHALSAQDRFYSIEFDFMGDSEEVPYQFTFDQTLIKKAEIENKTIYTKGMSFVHATTWLPVMESNVCRNGETAEDASMVLTIDSDQSVTITWNTDCLKDDITTKRFYSLKCTKGDVQF